MTENVTKGRSNRFPTPTVTFRSLIVLATLFLMAMAARADVEYCYTGKDFQASSFYPSVKPPFTTSDSISGCVTLTGALPTGTTPLTDYRSSVVSFFLTDGVEEFTQVTAPDGFLPLEFATDAGEISRWYVYLDARDSMITSDDVPGEGHFPTGDIGNYHLGQSDGANAYNENDPGVWSGPMQVGRIPEPRSVILLMTVIAFAGLLLRKKLRRPGTAFRTAATSR
jgi:hypothetical protein